MKRISEYYRNLELSSLQLALIVWILFSSLLLTFLVPPLQKPDEVVHFHKTVAVKNGLFGCNEDFYDYDQKFATQVDESVGKSALIQNYDGKYPYKEFIQPLFYSSNDKVTQLSSRICSLPTLSYIFPATTLVIGDLFNLNGILSYYLGRASNLILFYVVLALIVGYKGFSRNIRSLVLVVAGLPIFIHQVGSYSYDALHLISGLLLFAVIYTHSIKKRVTYKIFLITTVICSIFLLSKSGGYELFILSPLIILLNKINKNNWKEYVHYFLTTTVLIIVYILYKQSNVGVFSSGYGAPIIDPKLQIEFMVTHPFDFLLAFVNSHNDVDVLSSTFIGVLGWLDYKLGEILYLTYTVILFYVIYNFIFKIKHSLNKLQLFMFFLISTGTYLFIHLIMYLSWTPVGKLMIEGIQSRYFLISILFFVTSLTILGKNVMRSKKLVSLIILCVLSLSLLRSVYLRYYDYSYLYDEPTAHQLGNESSKIIIIADSKKLTKISLAFERQSEDLLFPLYYEIIDEASGETLRHGIFNINQEKSLENELKFRAIEGSRQVRLEVRNYKTKNNINLIIKSVTYLR